MAGMIPVDASLPSCPMDVSLQEDDTSVALSSLGSDNFVFVENTHPNKILEGLNNLRLKKEFCDVILCCGGQEFCCHRNVLASFSPYFEAMFTAEWMESQQIRVAINGVEPQMMDMMVNYAYTSKVLISTANVQALLATANLLNVMAVHEACCRYMERHMDEKNCIGIHCFAEEHSCKRLQKQSMDYILGHFTVVYQQEEFPSLSVDKLTEILSKDDLRVSKEEMVFEAAMLWLNKCPTTRRQSFEKVLEQIRLPHISPSFLHDVIECLDVVKESQGCQRIISEAKNQHLLPYSHRAQPRRATVIVMVAGRDDKGIVCSAESFDPLSSQFQTLASLPVSIHRHGLVVSGSTLYLAGGEFSDGSTSKDMWRYDPSHDSWLKMASMNAARYDFGLVMLDGYVFAVGGWNEETCVNSVERYDPDADTWRLMESVGMPEEFCVHAVVALDRVIYVIEDGSITQPTHMYKYNPNTSVWTQVAPMHFSRSGSASCTLEGKIYVIGGKDSAIFMNQVECYSPATNQWTTCSPMKKQRCHPGIAVVDGKIYVLGGLEGKGRFLHTIEQYCEDRDTWEIVAEMPAGRSCFSCASLRLRKDGHAIDETSTADNVPVN